MKKRIFFTILYFLVIKSFGQFDPMYSQYMRNMILINPGYAGIDDYSSMSLLHRQQWVGFEGAPTTTALSFHGPISRKRIGVGSSLIHDKVGPYNQLDFNLYFAYHLRISEKINIGSGFNGNVNYTSFDFSNLKGSKEFDPLFSPNTSRTLPNLGVGLLLYSRNWYFGFSLPRLFEASFNKNSNMNYVNSSKKQRSYFVNGGYIFNIGTYWKFKPATTLRISENLPLNGEFTANLILKDAFGFGAMYRLGESTGINLYYQINKKMSMGYAFDIPTWGGLAYSYGSHEVMLKFDFNKKEIDIVSPRHY